ncbi:hypothetical protein D9M72_436100 [compost metagenome]
MIARHRQLVVVDVDGRKDAVHVGVVVVERQRPFQFGIDLHPGRVLVGAPSVDPGLPEDAGPPGMGMGIAGVECHRPVDQRLGLAVVGDGAAMVQHLGGERAFIGRHVGRLRAGELVALGGLDAARQGGGDRRRHLVLNGEDIVQLPVVFVGPDMGVVERVDELDGDAHPLADLANAAFHQVLRPEPCGHLARVDRLVLVDEARIARDDEELMAARQRSDDVFGQAIGEELLIRVAAHVVERQHHDRRLADGPFRIGLVRRRRQDHAFGPDAIEMHGAADVLQYLLAKVFDRQFEAVGHLCRHRGGHADAADIGQLLDARGDVDAVAEDVVVLEDDVAEIDADAEFDPPVLRHVAVAPLHALLDLDRAFDRIGHALELDQHSVAGGLDQPALVLGDRRIDELDAVGSEPRKRARFVGFHQPTVAGHIGRQHCGESLLHGLAKHFEKRPVPGFRTKEITAEYYRTATRSPT